MAKQLKSGDIKKHLRHQSAHQDGDDNSSEAPKTARFSRDIANIFATLQKIYSDLASLEEIRRTTTSVEGKLSLLISRVVEVEKRVEWLEDSDKELKASLEASPLATKAELESLSDKLEDMENRNRRNNLRFVGVQEGKESGDMTVFMQKLLTSIFGWDETAQPPEIDRAHRAPTPRPSSGERPRTILVRFPRSANRELILRTARNKYELIWEGNRIMIFPDFSRVTQLKRDKFRECKKIISNYETQCPGGGTWSKETL
ncbi:hypothetical protein PAMP_024936 [Pampus punctatissimus]